MIEWPDIKFPPVNLYSLPHQRQWPPQYLTLEAQYVAEETQGLFDAQNEMEKEKWRKRILKKRIEFNRLWNKRAKEG